MTELDPDVIQYLALAVEEHKAWPDVTEQTIVNAAAMYWQLAHDGEPATDINMLIRWWVDKEIAENPNLSRYYVLK